MVVVKDIEFFSLCEHHILPFFGRAHLAYLPCGKLLGVSKLPRIVNMFARRLQLQERLTSEIVEAVGQVLAPRGVACLVECHHLCMMMRGVKSQHSCLTTTAFRGVFTDTPSLRSEFLQLIGKLPLSDNASGGIVP
jgi:GTP cyclohydrolase I